MTTLKTQQQTKQRQEHWGKIIGTAWWGVGMSIVGIEISANRRGPHTES